MRISKTPAIKAAATGNTKNSHRLPSHRRARSAAVAEGAMLNILVRINASAFFGQSNLRFYAVALEQCLDTRLLSAETAV